MYALVSRRKCAIAIEAMLEVPVFRFESLRACSIALESYQSGTADFSDFLIREIANDFHCVGVKTLDKKALREVGFKSL